MKKWFSKIIEHLKKTPDEIAQMQHQVYFGYKAKLFGVGLLIFIFVLKGIFSDELTFQIYFLIIIIFWGIAVLDDDSLKYEPVVKFLMNSEDKEKEDIYNELMRIVYMLLVSVFLFILFDNRNVITGLIIFAWSVFFIVDYLVVRRNRRLRNIYGDPRGRDNNEN